MAGEYLGPGVWELGGGRGQMVHHKAHQSLLSLGIITKHTHQTTKHQQQINSQIAHQFSIFPAK